MFTRIIPCTLLALAVAAAPITATAKQAFTVSVAGTAKGRFTQTQYANGFGCHGGNISPAIAWSGAPADAKSFVVTMYDPDAPTGSGWWHWVVVDLPATSDHLDAGASGHLPAGAVEIANDGKDARYDGPCPPTGEDHRYVVTVTALKVAKLDLPADPSGALVGFMTHMNAIAVGKATVRAAR